MVEEIVPGIYDITIKTDPGRRNRVFLTDFGVPTLIDAGFEDTTHAILKGIEEVGKEPERLIITHGDADHIGGYNTLVDAYDVETWVPEETNIPDGSDPDNSYVEGDKIGSFETIYTPGHEPDHYSLVNETEKILVAGDAVFGSDLRGLPSGYLIAPPAIYSQSVNEAEGSIEKLLTYDFDSVLVFHGTSVLEQGHARLDEYINFPRKPEWGTYL